GGLGHRLGLVQREAEPEPRGAVARFGDQKSLIGLDGLLPGARLEQGLGLLGRRRLWRSGIGRRPEPEPQSQQQGSHHSIAPVGARSRLIYVAAPRDAGEDTSRLVVG